MKLTVLLIVSTVLAIVIIYFLIRLRKTLREMPGANDGMNPKELIKNWQAEKAKENAYQEEIRKEAQEEARPEVKRILKERFKEEEIAKATTDKGTQFKDKLKTGLGIDIDKATSKENVEFMVGGKNTLNGAIGSTNVFDSKKLSGYTQGGVTQESLKRATNSDSINWGKGARAGSQSTHTFSGVERAVRRDTEYIPPNQNQKRRTPPSRP
jgi:hypothetical protein